MSPYIPYYRGSHTKHKKEIEEGITEWKEKLFPGRDHNYISDFKTTYLRLKKKKININTFLYVKI
ncbi:MAG: hypothetical protein KAW66_09780 [Candidatus Lokiarchaeota archaeon]|nr:hypothetical protein [Candidatus Lokiarchaeota archaeon]